MKTKRKRKVCKNADVINIFRNGDYSEKIKRDKESKNSENFFEEIMKRNKENEKRVNNERKKNNKIITKELKG